MRETFFKTLDGYFFHFSLGINTFMQDIIIDIIDVIKYLHNLSFVAQFSH